VVRCGGMVVFGMMILYEGFGICGCWWVWRLLGRGVEGLDGRREWFLGGVRWGGGVLDCFVGGVLVLICELGGGARDC